MVVTSKGVVLFLIQFEDKTDAFSIAGFIREFMSLLLLHRHYRYCCLFTCQTCCTLDKLTFLIARAGSFGSNIRIRYPVGTQFLCALPVPWLHMWKVCGFPCEICASIYLSLVRIVL